MSDDKKPIFPVIKRGGGMTVPKRRVQPIDLAKKSAVSKILNDDSTVRNEITQREQGLDLVLVGDLTGSMGSYHALLKEKFSSLFRDLVPLIQNLKIGIIFYLDHGSGDPYVTRVQQLTKNTQEVERFIASTSTGCGGDAKEAVEDAFNDILNLNWRDAGNRSVVLFGDACPHEPDECPSQYSYFDLAQRMHNANIIVNSVYCGGGDFSNAELQKLEDVKIGDFSKKVENLNPPNFFSWVANVTGGMIIGIEQIDDLIEIIRAAAAKDSGKMEEYEKSLKLRAPKKVEFAKIARRAQQRRLEAQKRLTNKS